LETFTEAREFVESTRFSQDRQDSLEALDLQTIDGPLVEIIDGFAKLPHCFTMQSCYGHFLHAPRQDIHSLDPLPSSDVGPVDYRIAYMAFCLENSPRGRALADALSKIPADLDLVHFGSADWFWERWANSYVLQVEPTRHMTRDQVVVDYAEALHLQHSRDLFFRRVKELLERQLSEHCLG
jgi:hypothetical protein